VGRSAGWTPVPTTQTVGCVPEHEISERQVMRSLVAKSGTRGLGAGMAVLGHVVLSIGGFDEQRGPGDDLRSSEDRDVTARVLAGAWWVLQFPRRVRHAHHLFCTWIQGRSLTRRDWYGIGAEYAKQLKCRNWRS
jgi:hypothetical protein